MTDQASTQPIEENDNPPIQPEPEEPTQTFDAEYVKKLRTEAAKNRKELKAVQAQLAELQQAQEAAATAELEAQGKYKELAEAEAAKRVELESQLQNERRRNIVLAAATQLGAIDPTDANFTAAVAGVDMTAEDANEQIKASLEGLKEARPYLFSTQKPALAPFDPTGGPQVPPKETRGQAMNRIYGGGGVRIFDRKTAEEGGGGVIFKE
jgi:hypothetical protein